jgi:CRP-like cAMP-binding protein
VKELTHAEQILIKIKSLIPFLAHLDDEQVVTVVDNVKFLKFNKFETIFEQDSTQKEAYFILNGRVNLAIGVKQRIGLLERFSDFKTVSNLPKKTLFGEMSALTGEKRTARATAYDPGTTLLAFSITEDLNDENADAYIKLYKAFISLLSVRLRRTNETLYNKKK